MRALSLFRSIVTTLVILLLLLPITLVIISFFTILINKSIIAFTGAATLDPFLKPH